MTDESDAPQSRQLLHGLSPADLGRLGVAQLAYVKPVVVNGARAFAIHAADGTPMAIAEDEASALAAIVQHELFPARVH